MKTILSHNSSFARGGALVIASLGLAVVSAFAVPTVELKVGGKDKNGDDFEFGKGLELNATSGTWVLSPSKAYSYKLVGTCTGTGALAGAFPKGTPITTFLNFLKPGSGSTLAGLYDNPTGKLGFVVLDKTYTGDRTLPGYGAVTLSAKITAGVKSNGEVYLNVTEVNFTSATPGPLGTIKFDNGAKFIINAAPQIQFKAKGQTAFSEGSGNIQISVTRFGNIKGATSVKFATVDGTASSVGNLDFVSTTGVINFAAKDSEEFITIPVTDNATKDGNRKFTIVLSDPKKGSVLGKNTVNTVVISDND